MHKYARLRASRLQFTQPNIHHHYCTPYSVTHHAHVGRLDGELSVGDEGDVVLLEDVLQVRDVLGVLVAVQRQARHLRPLELLEQLQVDVPAG